MKIYKKHLEYISDLGRITIGDKNDYDYVDKPVPSNVKKGFYVIPYYSRYLINAQGDLWDLKRECFSTFSMTKKRKNDKKNITAGYYYTRCKHDDGERTHGYRHRLLALATVPYHYNLDELVINHLNGIPGDDAVGNLEWVTKRENLLHALKNGLMPNSVKSVLVKDCKTGKEYEFDSVSDSSRFFGINLNTIYGRIKKGLVRGKDNLIFRPNNHRPWGEIPVEKKGSGIKAEVVSIEVSTNNITIYNSIMEAQRYTKVNTTYISEIIKGNRSGAYKGFIFKSLKKFKNEVTGPIRK